MNNPPSRTGKLVATMLSGNSEDLVIDAIHSAIDWIDELLLIDTGITDATVQRARRASGEKFACVSYAWEHDFASARNAAIQFAEQRDATWVMTLDTDERMTLSHYPDRDALIAEIESDPDVSTWLVAAQDDSYSKERFIRLPTQLRWCGRTHEALQGASLSERAILRDCGFWESPKTAEQFRKKLDRDLLILLEETSTHPLDARWWYYLGQTHAALDQKQMAVNAFTHCAQLDGWSEQSAWACYSAAKCLSEMKRFPEAEEIAAYGMTRDAGFPELPWIAAWCCYAESNDHRAIHWATMAASLGAVTGSHAGRDRVGFRFAPAWYEAPFDILRYAHRRLGSEQAAAAAERHFENGKELRARRTGAHRST